MIYIHIVSMEHKRLLKLRSRIDAIDFEILAMLSKRMRISGMIGIFKEKQELPVVDKRRWKELIETRVRRGAGGGLSSGFVRALFARIHKESTAVQKSKRA